MSATDVANERDRRGLFAWAFYDWANQGYPTVVQTFVFAAYFTRRVAEDAERGTTQWGFTIGAAGLAVAVTAPVLGAIADRAGRRKPWIAVFTALCCAAVAGLWFVRPGGDSVMLALALLWLATLGSQLALVFYNAMLPDLVAPSRLGRWSGWGWAIGYAGGLVCLCLILLLFIADSALVPLPRAQAEHVRAAFPFVAVWYALFALPLFLRTPDRPSAGKPWRRAVREGLQQLRESIRDLRRYRNLVRFLVARVFYTDGLATIFALGGVYAAGTFDMTETEVLAFGIGLTITAGLGAAAFSWLDDRFGGRRIVIVSLIALIALTAAILLVGEERWFWVCGLLLGVFVGPAQASSRSYLSRVAPEPMRAQLFGLYELSDKATSFLGPLLVGWLTWLTQSQRIGMAVIPVLLAVGLVLMLGTKDDRSEAARR